MARRNPPPIDEVRLIYDREAHGFDARFQADPRTVARFRLFDAPHKSIAAGARRVLELGCGSGRLLAQLDGGIRIGIDVSGGLLAVAWAKGLCVVHGDAQRLPFPDGSFDAVCSGNAVFRHLDYERTFAECVRVLQPGGRLAVQQYAARPFRLRAGPPPSDLDLDNLHDMLRPARAAGLIEERVFLWRNLRFPPYALPLPRPVAWRLWTQAVFVFRKL